MASGRVFTWADYMVFGGMLLISALVGVYHGLKSRREKCSEGGSKTGEFLTGNGQMSTAPVAISMLASFLSSITLIGQPAEVYLFGPQMWVFGVALFFALPVVGYVFIPLYHRLRLTSAYEYVGQRFCRKLQLLASLLFTAQMVLYLALVLYAPALALYQVTGINKEAIVSVMYVVVIFYTTIGGIKAVVWTDCFQVLVLFVAMLAVLGKGTADIGGWGVVWQRNVIGERNEFFNLSGWPTDRYTFWSCLVGAAFLHVSVYGVNQLQVQRYLTVGTVQQARKMLWINGIGWTLVVMLTVYAGMLIYAKYFDCDPLTSGMIHKADQLFPLYVMDTLGDYPGFPGVFVAGIFSAGLSTVSTGLNSLAAIWFAELEGTQFKIGLSEAGAALTVKLMALVFGLVSFGFVFLVPFMGGLAPVAIAVSSFFSGSLFGVFILGIFVPWANSVGAFSGLLAGVCVVGWITIGAQVAAEDHQRIFTVLPLYTNNCPANTSLPLGAERDTEDAFVVYRISFLWYSFISIVVTIFVGMVVSYATQKKKTSLDYDKSNFEPEAALAKELLLSGEGGATRMMKTSPAGDVVPVHHDSSV